MTNQISTCLGTGTRKVEGITNGHEEPFVSDRYIPYLWWCFLGYMCVRTYQVAHWNVQIIYFSYNSKTQRKNIYKIKTWTSFHASTKILHYSFDLCVVCNCMHILLFYPHNLEWVTHLFQVIGPAFTCADKENKGLFCFVLFCFCWIWLTHLTSSVRM